MTSVIEGLCASLRRYNRRMGRSPVLRNPDGPKAAATIESMADRIAERDTEILRLVDALVFAHEQGFEWPDDPMKIGSLAHSLFIERGNDPERITANA